MKTSEPADNPAEPRAGNQAHVQQLLLRAQTGWLAKHDVLDILTNWQEYTFRISMTPPDQPGPGSLFLFDRTQLRSFRRDNHIWRKKPDGKSVQETHEKLKIEGGIQALNCYYAHSADGLLQRRCYWKLSGNEAIVLMHYQRSSASKTKTRGTVQPVRIPASPSKPGVSPQHPDTEPSSQIDTLDATSGQLSEGASPVQGGASDRPLWAESRAQNGHAQYDMLKFDKRDAASLRHHPLDFTGNRGHQHPSMAHMDRANRDTQRIIAAYSTHHYPHHQGSDTNQHQPANETSHSFQWSPHRQHDGSPHLSADSSQQSCSHYVQCPDPQLAAAGLHAKRARRTIPLPFSARPMPQFDVHQGYGACGSTEQHYSRGGGVTRDQLDRGLCLGQFGPSNDEYMHDPHHMRPASCMHSALQVDRMNWHKQPVSKRVRMDHVPVSDLDQQTLRLHRLPQP